ncbi:MAG TPA: SDR family oxidoreductase [Micromonosporaceae bacterium]|nr:SDR family oxidoreductase [Micromonosporaceae bacterium]
MAPDQYTRQDPTTQYDQRQGQPAQQQTWPGETDRMQPVPDHGERSYRGSGRLAGRRAVVTGGDSGIGRAVAIAYAREGADVLISYLSEDADAAQTVRQVEEAGRRAVAVPGDLTEEEHCQRVIDRAAAEFGGIDILANIVGYQMGQSAGLAGITTEQLDRVFKTNLYALFWLCKAAIEHMPPGSCIVNTASIQAYQPSPQLLDYASTKAAIVNFTRALAAGVVDKGIRVNAVAPGAVWTPLIPTTMPSKVVESFGVESPIGRPGQPAEIAPAYVFLASHESSFVTGEVLAVTGGRPTT